MFKLSYHDVPAQLSVGMIEWVVMRSQTPRRHLGSLLTDSKLLSPEDYCIDIHMNPQIAKIKLGFL